MNTSCLGYGTIWKWYEALIRAIHFHCARSVPLAVRPHLLMQLYRCVSALWWRPCGWRVSGGQLRYGASDSITVRCKRRTCRSSDRWLALTVVPLLGNDRSGFHRLRSGDVSGIHYMLWCVECYAVGIGLLQRRDRAPRRPVTTKVSRVTQKLSDVFKFSKTPKQILRFLLAIKAVKLAYLCVFFLVICVFG